MCAMTKFPKLCHFDINYLKMNGLSYKILCLMWFWMDFDWENPRADGQLKFLHVIFEWEIF